MEEAFQARLKAVDGWPGFQHLEVWADVARPTEYSMVSWWDTPEAFRAYMQSADHRRSHERVATDEKRPRAVKFRRFRVVAR